MYTGEQMLRDVARLDRQVWIELAEYPPGPLYLFFWRAFRGDFTIAWRIPHNPLQVTADRLGSFPRVYRDLWEGCPDGGFFNIETIHHVEVMQETLNRPIDE